MRYRDAVEAGRGTNMNRIAGLFLVLAGCEAASAAEPSPRPRATVVAMPGPAHEAPPASRARLNDTCVDCHEDAAKTWSKSLHRQAWTEDDFAQVREPRAFCRSCHAPESDPQRPPSSAAADIGVACVTCHVPLDASLPPGAVLASPREETPSPSPHRVVRSAAFASADACAGCHEFSSPRQPSLALQATVSEHARSDRASQSCSSCHMPQGSHAFAASRDRSVLRSAIDASAACSDAHTIAVTLLPRHVGHAVPTGDPFRRLLVEVDAAVGDAWVPMARKSLRRNFESGRGLSTQRVEHGDTRVGGTDDVAVHTFDLGSTSPTTLRWRVVYERLDHPFGSEDPLVFGRIPLFEGELPPCSTP